MAVTTTKPTPPRPSPRPNQHHPCHHSPTPPPHRPDQTIIIFVIDFHLPHPRYHQPPPRSTTSKPDPPANCPPSSQPPITTLSPTISSTPPFSLPNLSLDLNLTLLLSVAVYNPNRVSFRYADGGSADLRYRDRLVGEAVIPPGGIGSRGSAHLDVTLTVLAGRLIGDSEVYADLAGGSVALVTYTTLPGRVSVLGIIRKHLVSYTTCDVTVDVRNRTVSSSDCRYKTKL